MVHKPRKRFGQNFLQDSFFQQKIADSISLKEGAKCLEIGPGKGAITNHLLARFGSLIAIEMDRDLIALLQSQFPQSAFQLHEADVLAVDFKSLADGYRLSIIGNLPYNISSPLLFHLMDYLEVVDEMVFMLQKEVVDRLVSPPGSKTYGRLSVMAGLKLHSEKLFDVPPTAFNPAPKVMSSVVRLWPRVDVDTSLDLALFEQIVKAGFSQRRKTIRKTLSKWISEQALFDLGINPQHRAEQLSIDMFAKIIHNINTH